MGIVYRARDRRLKRIVAVKVLPPELAFRSEIKTRFLREAETAAQLSHPNIVPIYTVDESGGLVYFVMACVDGSTLAKRLHDEGKLPIEDTRTILKEVADALAYAHARGVVHRDIKPDNILLNAEDGRAIVTDFGIARAVQEGADSRLTATGVAIGTPAYMSPEQAAGDRVIDGRSDLYSLGVVGYQMLAGRLPFEAQSTASLLVKQISEQPKPVGQFRPDTPPEMSVAVMTMLEKEPDHRFPSAAALGLVLDGDMSALPSSAPGADQPRSEVAMRRPSAPHTLSPLPAAAVGDAGAAFPHTTTPTPEEIARWSAPEVQRFRKNVAPFLFVNAVLVMISLFSDSNWMVVTGIWSVILAIRYSRLWTAGYDWHDVFRQPRDKTLADVSHEMVDDVRAFFDPKARQRVKARPQAPRLSAPAMGSVAPVVTGDYGSNADVVRQAERDRGEILQLVAALPRSDQPLVDGVIPAADGLYRSVQALALSVRAQERAAPAGAADQLSSEISGLEAQANPLDGAASEERVRRLAKLKRERRAFLDAERKRAESAAKLESCALALQNMRIDVLRLSSGGMASAGPQLTMLTERARRLAEEVDAAVHGVSTAQLSDRGRT